MFLSLEATPRTCQDHHPKKVHVVRKPLHAFASAVTAVVVRGKDELFLNSSLCGLLLFFAGHQRKAPDVLSRYIAALPILFLLA